MDSGLAQRIRERLDVLGISPRRASIDAAAGVDLVRGVLNGRVKSLRGDNATRLAKVLNVSVEWLLTGQGDLPPDSPAPPHLPLRVPLLSWVSAGKMSFPDVSDEKIGTVEEGGLDPGGDWIALQVVGDSMDRISPPESIIFVDRSDKVLVPNACYVISNGDGEATYKRFRSNPMRFEPVSTNPAHEPIYPMREPLIVGRVKKSTIQM